MAKSPSEPFLNEQRLEDQLANGFYTFDLENAAERILSADSIGDAIRERARSVFELSHRWEVAQLIVGHDIDAAVKAMVAKNSKEA